MANTYRRPGPPAPTHRSLVHEMVIPDDLLAWGSDPTVYARWTEPWGLLARQAIETATQAADDDALSLRATQSLLSLLEALTGEAVRAGRPDLLLGFDVVTADILGLVYVVTRAGREPVEVGRKLDWTFTEIEVVRETADPAAVMRLAERAKDVMAELRELMPEISPNLRIGAATNEAALCCSCGKPCAVMTKVEGDLDICQPCWALKTSRISLSNDALRDRNRESRSRLPPAFRVK